MGFVPLSHLKATPSNQIEFYEGDYLDPRTGKQYKTRARLNRTLPTRITISALRHLEYFVNANASILNFH